jgi:hypothetical protein
VKAIRAPSGDHAGKSLLIRRSPPTGEEAGGGRSRLR